MGFRNERLNESGGGVSEAELWVQDHTRRCQVLMWQPHTRNPTSSRTAPCDPLLRVTRRGRTRSGETRWDWGAGSQQGDVLSRER